MEAGRANGDVRDREGRVEYGGLHAGDDHGSPTGGNDAAGVLGRAAGVEGQVARAASR